jgi:hypothetical protein
MDSDLFIYLAAAMPAAKVECEGCGGEAQADRAVIRLEKTFCSDACADRSTALLRKPQPAGVKLGGWDV